MEGILAIVFIFGGGSLFLLAISPVGRAIAERIRHGQSPPGGAAADQEEVIEAVDQLRREVAELAERVDFTERLLGQQRGGDRIGGPRP
ncbi:MAG TPA: hypothetical protein VN908_09325 [Gemmatimonadales bacterium]|nr:hypothetical protein [Gemmatimonadales bacterium]